MQISAELARAQLWLPWGLRGARVLVILVGAWLLTRLSRRLLSRLRIYTIRAMDRHRGGPTLEMEKRAATLTAVLGKLISLVIWLVALVMSLTELEFHIEPLLAGLGI